jgi:hypothetical protein
MKRSLHFVVLIATVCSFAVPSISLAGPKEKEKQQSKQEKPQAAPKISQKDAKHTVLFKYTGASIVNCELTKGKDHPNWVVTIARPDIRGTMQVEVDGVTGNIIENNKAEGSQKAHPPQRGSSGY